MGDGDELDFWSSAPAQGFSVCSECFADEDIKAFIEVSANSQLCSFCGRRGRTRSMAAPLDQVVEFMFEALDREYERAVEALGWDGAEGGYQGTHWDSRELLADEIGLELPKDEDGRLLDVLADCFGDEPWCQRNPYSLRRDERLLGSWEEFCEFIKHERRYFFLERNEPETPSLREYLTPPELLDFIGDTVVEHELIRVLPQGSLIYRARQQKPGDLLHSPYDFGPPPVELATSSNRMSPAGIVMFYGSDDRKTATAELEDDHRKGIVVGTFKTTRDAIVLDLTRLPRCLRFFENQADSSAVDRHALDFLHSFVRSLAAKVEPGKREYIDYVPTQVVTEWFRTAFRHGGHALDGIRYMSTQRPGGKSVVLFADRHDVVLSPKQLRELAPADSIDEWQIRSRHEKAWLKLVGKRVVRTAET